MTELPKLALGTWLMGGTKEPDPNNDDAKDMAVIKTALDFGISLIDTAQNYAGGRCEELVGEAVRDYDRSSFQILTKQNKAHLTYKEVIEGCRSSMKRIGIDYIDYFVCHAPNIDLDMREFFLATNKLHKEGLVRNIGVSNFGPKMLQIAIETSEVPIALNQVSFSINDSDILTTGTYEYCIQNKIPIQAYRTLIDLHKAPQVMEALESVSKRLGLNPQQVAIAYINSYKDMHFTVRASTPEHWQELKDALSIKLEATDIEKLKNIHIAQKGRFGDFLLA